MSSNTNTSTRHEPDRQTERQSPTEETETAESHSQEKSTCPECGGDIVYNEKEAEDCCEDCGLIINDEHIDHGPEWHNFDSDEGNNSRVGAPHTELLHDNGLSTDIDFRDKDAYGNPLSSKKRRQMSRLRKWDDRFKTKTHAERKLRQALSEIQRMGSSLGIDETIQETASVLFQRLQEENLLIGRSIEGLATGSLHIATRINDQPVPLNDFHAVSRVEPKRVDRDSLYIIQELELAVEPADPREYLNRYISKLGFNEPETVRSVCMKLLDAAENQNAHVGVAPTSLAAGAIYAAGLLKAEKVTQSELADITGVSKVTVRNRYKDIIRAYEKESGKDILPE